MMKKSNTTSGCKRDKRICACLTKGEESQLKLVLEACPLDEAEFARPGVSRPGMFTQDRLYQVRRDRNGEAFVMDDGNRANYGHGLVCRTIYFKYKNNNNMEM